MYKAIDRKTQNFHVMYEPGGPTIINLLDGDRELGYFYNHNAQTEFLSAIQFKELYGELSNEFLDAECRALRDRQGRGPKPPKLLIYKHYRPTLTQKIADFFKNKIINNFLSLSKYPL